jgi:hypothetical protein
MEGQVSSINEQGIERLLARLSQNEQISSRKREYKGSTSGPWRARL